MTTQTDTLRDGLTAVGALMVALAGDPKRKTDRGQLSRVIAGRRHLWSCNYGMWLQAGDSLRGGQPCSERCVQAHEALRLGAVFLQALIDECNATAEPRLREAV